MSISNLDIRNGRQATEHAVRLFADMCDSWPLVSDQGPAPRFSGRRGIEGVAIGFSPWTNKVFVFWVKEGLICCLEKGVDGRLVGQKIAHPEDEWSRLSSFFAPTNNSEGVSLALTPQTINLTEEEIATIVGKLRDYRLPLKQYLN